MSAEKIIDYLVDPNSYKFDEECISRTDFSVVTTCKKGDEKYAVKILRTDDFNPIDQKYFFREVCAYASIQHPCSVKFRGFSLISPDFSWPMVFLDYISGGTLEEAMKKGNLTPTEKMKIIAGTTAFTAHLHSNGLYHRNIRPDNILLDKNKEPKIIDFYETRIYGESSTPATQVGEGEYSAPELFTSDVPDPSSDIYSIGILIYELISKKDGFERMNTRDVKHGKRPKLGSEFPKKMKQIIKVSWDNDPKNRPTAHEILFNLGKEKSFLEGTDVESYMEFYDRVVKETDPEMSEESIKLKEKCINGDFIDFYKFAKNILDENEENNDPMVERVAIEYLEKSAKEGFYLACYELGKIYIEKDDSELNERAVELFKKGAEYKHPDSIFELGMCYKKGRGVKKNNKKALKYFSDAGQKGHTEANIKYCTMLLNGKGTDGDEETLKSNRKKAATILSMMFDSDDE